MTDAPAKSLMDVVTDFIASAPSLQAIADYCLPSDLQERAHDLLDKNRAGNLNEEERHEMDEFRQLDHILTLVKAKARLKLKE